MVASVGPIAFYLELPPDWKTRNIFHALQLYPAVKFDGTVSAHQDNNFCVAADANDEFEVEDLLEHRSCGGCVEYLVK